MSFFSSVSEMASTGLNWGKSAAKDLGSKAISQANKAVNYVGEKYDQSKNYVDTKVDEGIELAKEAKNYVDTKVDEGIERTKEIAVSTKNYVDTKVDEGIERTKEIAVSAQSGVAAKAVGLAVKDHERRDNLLNKLDKRDRFTSTVCQECGNPDITHPDKRDGQYMGAECPSTADNRPEQGVKPDGCECGKDGKAFTKITFTNGINNTTQQVCATMHALANNRCVEVVGIYNATYNDPSLKAPERQLSDYKDAAVSGAKGSVKGAAKGALTGGGVGAAKGAAVGLAKGAAPEIAIQEASRSGVIQDVVDCVQTINGSGDEAATDTLSKDIVSALSKDPPEKMTIYAHSQGGLNTAAAIAQAKRELIASEISRLMESGVAESMAEKKAEQFAEVKLANLEVNSFGTLERGLPDGPIYNRHTNDYDPIPKVIKEAQKSYTPDLIARDPKKAPSVKRFKFAPTWNAIDAHGMQEAYLPWLNKVDPKGPCC